jgi:hypothetical protein
VVYKFKVKFVYIKKQPMVDASAVMIKTLRIKL